MKKKRPKYKVIKRMSPVDTIIFLVKVLFTKYEGWSHEDEYRMVIMDNGSNSRLENEYSKSDYYTITTNIISKFYGCNSSYLNKLNKNDIDYKLE